MRDVLLRFGISEGTFARHSFMVRFLTVLTSGCATMRKLPGAQNFSKAPKKPTAGVLSEGTVTVSRSIATETRTIWPASHLRHHPAHCPGDSTRLPQHAPLRLLGQPGAAGEARAMPYAPGARHPLPYPGRARGPQDSRGRTVAPGAVGPVGQHGRLHLGQTLSRQPAAWDLARRCPRLLLFQQGGGTHPRIEAHRVYLPPVIDEHDRDGERA